MGLIKFSVLKNPKPIISGPIKNGTNYDFSTVEYKYKKKFSVQNIGEDQRLIISPPDEHIKLMLDLIKGDENDEFSLKYILLVSRCKNDEGRYETENCISWETVNEFCDKYVDYLQTDGRHNFWIINETKRDLIVYDQHNVLYTYGDLMWQLKIVDNNGYKNAKDICFPEPHGHHYHEENDNFEKDILKSYKWKYLPFEEGDYIK